MSYGTDQVEMFGQTATYIDRILRGAKPADLSVQAPTRYETVLNLKTAKALGPDGPPALLGARRGDRMTYVRYWHKADMPSCTAHVRFRG